MLDHKHLDEIVAASPDQLAALQALTAEVDAADAYATRARELRVQIALGLHNSHVPMTVIARAARMGDSYLARQVYAAGGTRRLERKT